MARWLVVAAAVIAAACAREDDKLQHFTNGERLLAEGKPAEAVVELLNAVQNDDRWGEARIKLSEAYAAAGDGDKAFREALRAADLLPANASAQLKAITYLLLAEQFQD